MIFLRELCVLHKISFTDADWKSCIDGLEIAPDIRDWVYLQIQRGQDYYSARIERLGLRGQRVLDAGCGMGNWSLALARWFDEVHGLEITASRLEILEAVCPWFNGRIHTKHGSIENLPYPDGWFDAVFCNGVIFLTDYQKSLKEFHRVLRRGGMVYLSFNGMAWWTHLIQQRARENPVNFTYGANALINLLFRYQDEVSCSLIKPGQIRQVVEKALLSNFGEFSWLGILNRDTRTLRAYEAYADSDPLSARSAGFEKDIIEIVAQGFDRTHTAKTTAMANILRTFLESSNPLVPDNLVAPYRRHAIRDILSRLMHGISNYRIETQTHSFEPEDMTSVMNAIGFDDVVTNFEGNLVIDKDAPAVSPIYSTEAGVFEALGRCEVDK